MTAFVILILVCVAAYVFLQRNTARGINTVRAYLYLRAINAGETTDEANRIAHAADIVNGSAQTIRDAMGFVQSVYGGSQLTMITDAKRRGLIL